MLTTTKKIALFVKDDGPALEKARELSARIAGKGIGVLFEVCGPPVPDVLAHSAGHAPPDIFCVLALGGDGTFLSAARWVGDLRTPILGVKFGEVGFLSEITHEQADEAMEAVLSGNFSIEPRTRLCVTVTKNAETVTRQTVLNDAVLVQRTLARLSYIEVHVDGQYLTTYRADGLIVATPTGSTAYSLAAGGPILHPAVKGTILSPICPFTLTNRPLIVPDSAKLDLRLKSPSETPVTLTFDGQAGMTVGTEHLITITQAQTPTNIIRVGGQHYFDVLKTKLRWSGRL